MHEIYVDDIGTGYPLVLVHGYLGSSEMWTLQKKYLSKFLLNFNFDEQTKYLTSPKHHFKEFIFEVFL